MKRHTMVLSCIIFMYLYCMCNLKKGVLNCIFSGIFQFLACIFVGPRSVLNYNTIVYLLTCGSFSRSWPDNVHILQACHKLTAASRKHGMGGVLVEENLQQIFPYLRLNLCSSSHSVRLLTLKILASFEQLGRSSSNNKVQCHINL